MTDTLTADAPAVAPPTGPTLSPEAVAQMRETWVSQGLDPAAFDVAAGLVRPPGDPSATTPAEISETAATAPPGVQIEPFTPDQLVSMAEALTAAGMDPERVHEALNADLSGHGMEADLVDDERTEEEIEFDRLYPEPEPSQYRPNYYGKVPEGTPPSVLQEYDTAARQWAASIGLCQEVGSHVIGEALKIGQSLGRANETDRTLYKIEQAQLFERISGGPEAAAERVKAAGQLLASAPQAFTDALRASGALDSAEIVTLLAAEAERLALRK